MLIVALTLQALAGVVGYLLGSIPFGIVMAKAFGLGDLRKIGSGNIGATNVLRTGNKLAAFLTLVLDSGKGAIAVLLARWLLGDAAAMIAGAAAFIGHCYPVYLGFRGGKGVATFLGTVLALSFPVGLVACAIWLVSALIWRMSSLAALVAAFLTPGCAILLGMPVLGTVLALMGALIFWRHRENIARIRAGTESRIGQK